MSTCISSHGEYSRHELPAGGPERFLCTRCWVFDEEAAMAALASAEAQVERVRALAQEAVVRIGGSHTHWRVGGAGRVCQTCESQRETQAEFQARLDALAPQPAATEEGRP